MVESKKIIIAALISSKSDKEGFLIPIRKELTSKGNEILGEIIQRRGVSRGRKTGGSKRMDAPLNSNTYMGSGKILELKEEVESKQADLVIFLNNLKSSQQSVIENIIGCKVEVIDYQPFKRIT